MRPRSGFIVKRSAARCIITLFDRGILQPQERLNHASPGRLRGREDELRAVNRTALIGSGEVNNRGLTNAGTNPSPTVWLRTRLKWRFQPAYSTILVDALQRQRQI